MNKDLPKWVQVFIVLVIGVAALLVFFSRDRIHVYGTYLREKSPHINTQLSFLTADMNEAMIQKHFEGLPLRCYGQRPGEDALGDRVCHASIDRADGDAALTLAVFFRKGRLAHLLVQMPWWVHASWVQRLTAQFGAPYVAGSASRMGEPVLRWTLQHGYVDTNRNRSFNPLNWNAILWSAKRGGQ